MFSNTQEGDYPFGSMLIVGPAIFDLSDPSKGVPKFKWSQKATQRNA